MTSIELTSITGIAPPYVVYACDIYGAFCTPIATISGAVPPPNTIVLPPSFWSAPAVGIKVVTSECTRFEVFFCTELFPQHVCLILKLELGPTFSYYYNFTIDENINGKPSYVGSYFGSPQILFWDGSQWVISPLGLTNPNEDLFFGIWYSLGSSTSFILSNSYCPSICILIFDGVTTTSFFLQKSSLIFLPPTPLEYDYYAYDDGVTSVVVIWDFINNIWLLYLNNTEYGTLPGYTQSDIPLGTWVLSVPFVGTINTILECPV